ncbi:hypothetical protein [Micromonospora wenchangensis]|uniref:hypothetical protein n=1 Tax=Micromonospora wenchangensis TaxID=1185415 RepID=UPI003D746193
MKRSAWELPYWVLWLGGVLEAHGYSDMGVLDLYTDPGTFNEPGRLAKDVVEKAARDNPADLFSPMTVNLCYAYEISTVIKQVHPAATVVYGGRGGDSARPRGRRAPQRGLRRGRPG